MLIDIYPVPNNKLTLKPLNTPDQESCIRFLYKQSLDYTGQIYTDQTVILPVLASRVYQYSLFCYDFDSNGILTDTIKNRYEGEIIRAYNEGHKDLLQQVLRPLLQKLDNKASAGLKIFMRGKAVYFQLVSPHLHQINATKRAIETIKNDFIAVLSSTNKYSPIRVWY